MSAPPTSTERTGTCSFVSWVRRECATASGSVKDPVLFDLITGSILTIRLVCFSSLSRLVTFAARKNPPAIRRGRVRDMASAGAVTLEGMIQADLATGCSLPARFAIKAARRTPRCQGISVFDVSAVLITDRIKRLLVFMLLSCSFLSAPGHLPLVEHQIARPFGQVWGGKQ